MDDDFLEVDFWMMLAASVVLVPFVFLKWKMSRAWGATFVIFYGLYLYMVLE